MAVVAFRKLWIDDYSRWLCLAPRLVIRASLIKNLTADKNKWIIIVITELLKYYVIGNWEPESNI